MISKEREKVFGLCPFIEYLKWLGLRQILEKNNWISMDEGSFVGKLRPHNEDVGMIHRFSGEELPQVLLHQWWVWSHQQPYTEQTSDRKRLISWQKFQAWLESSKSKREFYMVVGRCKKLIAMAWMAEGKILGDVKDFKLADGVDGGCLLFDFSSAVRVYSELGKGTGTALKKIMMEDVEIRNSKMNGFWFSTSIDNKASLRMNAKLGFRELGRSEDERTVYMGKGIKA
ncbi:hypothetical protein KKE34_03435 [Patescibacteria group bacterium]|nr:hypothetical protein [Patescibacteria group bacterium]MBU1885640.1 hypothetical protein [Patescibacteria group bacterium]